MPTILDRIVASKWHEIEQSRAKVALSELEKRLSLAPSPRDFRAAIDRPDEVRIIAEVKKASPSAGVLRADFDPAAIASIFGRHGAAAISVLTDGPFFQGSLSHLTAIRGTVEVPLLRKDFIVDRYQLVEARAAGADAVLLIAEILPGEALAMLVRQARDLGLQALVELYDADNLPRVVESGAQLIGINNRDLRTFETRLEHTVELAAQVPRDRCLISESGIRTRADIERLEEAGVRAVLVGETLMRAADMGAELERLAGRFA
jgi:indole-3-glycerol phosphate synthase